MAYTLEPKVFDFRRIRSFSQNQLEQHYKLYLGYIKKVNEIRERLESPDLTDMSSAVSPYRCLKVMETYALNGAKLHEMYFRNIGGVGGAPTGELKRMIEERFGSYERWKRLFAASASAGRGWAVLAWDPFDRRLHNYIQDSHDEGVVVMTYPILLLDVYEHAYLIDFGIDREAYINAFFETVDWDVAGSRLSWLTKHKAQS